MTYHEGLQDAPFSDRALDSIPDDMDLDELAEQTTQEKLQAMMGKNYEIVMAMPDFEYEVNDEFGRRVLITKRTAPTRSEQVLKDARACAESVVERRHMCAGCHMDSVCEVFKLWRARHGN